MSTSAWVVGAGGLLGRALQRALRAQGIVPFAPATALDWKDVASLQAQVDAALTAFAHHAAGSARWQIYWAAGVGTMGCDEAALLPESIALDALLHAISAHPVLTDRPGAFAFASSAGALHADGADVVTEHTEPTPNTAYGRAKLQLEARVRAAFAQQPRQLALLARISTLYGFGATADRRQGLLTHIARCLLANRPVQIYVPFDTVRDYIAVDDAALAVVAALQAMRGQSGVQLRIVASERPVTIAEIVSIFKRVGHRAPRVTTSVSRLSAMYARQVRFRSVATDDAARVPRRSLLIGIAELLRDERLALARSTPPSAPAR